MIEFRHECRDLQDKVRMETTHKLLMDESLHEVFQEFRHFLIAIGYSPDAVNDYVGAD